MEEKITMQNVKKAFMRECSAFMEYTFYSEQAKLEKLDSVSKEIDIMTQNEKAHALIWFKLYHTVFGTEENLKNSADLEHFEWSVMYDEFSKTATKEGFPDIARLFNEVAKIEMEHEKKFKDLKNQLKSGKLFKGNKQTTYVCGNCGKVITGATPPETCPVCSANKGFFKKQA